MLRTRTDITTWTKTDDGAIVVLDLRSSRYLSLNGSGAVLWERLAEGADADRLAAELVTQFGIDDERAARDVDAFIADLRERELIADQD